ncbi:hypothetical protein Tco_0488126 [Tanacetum coccineum]
MSPSSSNSLADCKLILIALLTLDAQSHDGQSHALCNFGGEIWVLFVFGNEQFASNSWLWRSDSRECHYQNGFITIEGRQSQSYLGCQSVMLNWRLLSGNLHQKESSIVKSISKFKGKAEFASHGACWSNASCKHKWEEVNSGDVMTIQDTIGHFFLRSKDETPEVSPRLSHDDSLNLQAQDLLQNALSKDGTVHLMSCRTMLSASKLPLHFGLKHCTKFVSLPYQHENTRCAFISTTKSNITEDQRSSIRDKFRGKSNHTISNKNDCLPQIPENVYVCAHGFELTSFSDADHAGCLDTRKKHFWRYSSLEAEYEGRYLQVVAQVMLMRTQLQDFASTTTK